MTRRPIARTQKRSKKNLKRAATALTAAGTIAGGTQAYAIPIRFDNPAQGQPGHYSWPDFSTLGAPGLNITAPAALQPSASGPRFGWDDHFAPPQSSGCSLAYGAITWHCIGQGFRGLDFVGSDPATAQVTSTPFFNSAESIPAPAESWSDFKLLAGELQLHACYYTLYPGQTPNPPGCNIATEGGLVGIIDSNAVVPNGANSPFYLGVRFDQGQGFQYGWIGAKRNGFSLTTFAWGYETDPGVPIAAGAVPEPGTLALLAFGATAVASRRRKPRAD